MLLIFTKYHINTQYPGSHWESPDDVKAGSDEVHVELVATAGFFIAHIASRITKLITSVDHIA